MIIIPKVLVRLCECRNKVTLGMVKHIIKCQNSLQHVKRAPQDTQNQVLVDLIRSLDEKVTQKITTRVELEVGREVGRP